MSRLWLSVVIAALPSAALGQAITATPSPAPMAPVTIDKLDPAPALTDSDLIMVLPGGTTTGKKLSIGTLKAYIGTGTPPVEPPIEPPPNVNPNAFYVAPNGADTNAGTLAAPFKTFLKAQQAMRGSATNKTTYIRAGTYRLTPSATNYCSGYSSSAGIDMPAADNGETFAYYPPDGANTAILDGGGVGTLFCLGGNNITIDGIQGQNAVNSIVNMVGNNSTVKNSHMHDISAAQFQGIIQVGYRANGNTVTHNYIHGSKTNGIIVNSGCPNCGNVSNSTVTYNFVENVCTGDSDCGPIYFEDMSTPRSTALVMDHNYVRYFDTHTAPQCCLVKGGYLDAGASNLTMTNNVITGFVGNQNTSMGAEYCYFIHGGNNTVFKGNICDIGAGGNVALIGIQTAMTGDDMKNNTYTNNILVTNGPQGIGYYDLGNGGGGATVKPNVTGNGYWNYNGSAMNYKWTNGGQDANPTYVNPQFSCWTYKLAASSPMYNAPVSFPQQGASWGTAGFWGPPGFVVPQTGSPPPSSPHSC